MARINIEDELFIDPRFANLVELLCGDVEKALGMISMFWFASQRRWGRNELLSKKEFRSKWNPLIEAGFAEERPEGIYAVGAETRFAWYRQKVEAGKKGGLATTKPINEREEAEESETKREEAEESGSNPPVPVPINKKKYIYPPEFEEAYLTYPKRSGKADALKIYQREILNAEDQKDLLRAIEVYKAWLKKSSSPSFLRQPRDFDRFMRGWRQYLDADFGRDGPQEENTRTYDFSDG